jgi:hypothetical protein
MFSALLRRLYWRVIGSPAERAESWRRKESSHVPLEAVRAHAQRYREPAAQRIRREHEAISRELLELTRARHTLAAQGTQGAQVIQLKRSGHE